MRSSLAAIYVLWLRQLKKYFRSRSRIIGSLGQPILFLVALSLGVGPLYQRAGEGNYIQFIVPGIISMSVLFTATFSGIEIIWDRQFGFLKETLVAPVSRLAIMMGRTLGGATIAIFQGLIILLVSTLAGFRPVSASMFPIGLLFMFLIAVLFTAVGTVIASVLEDLQGFNLVISFLIMPLFFLSGALFPLEGLPPSVEFVVRIDPLTYGVDGLRGALTGATGARLFTDLAVLGSAVVALSIIGAYLFSKTEV